MRDGCGHQSSFVADVGVEEVLASARLLVGGAAGGAEDPTCASLTLP